MIYDVISVHCAERAIFAVEWDNFTKNSDVVYFSEFKVAIKKYIEDSASLLSLLALNDWIGQAKDSRPISASRLLAYLQGSRSAVPRSDRRASFP